eukprot:282299-Prymnesium_polylepis.1
MLRGIAAAATLPRRPPARSLRVRPEVLGIPVGWLIANAAVDKVVNQVELRVDGVQLRVALPLDGAYACECAKVAKLHDVIWLAVRREHLQPPAVVLGH